MRILMDMWEGEATEIEEIGRKDLIKCWEKEDRGNKYPTYLELQFDYEYEGCYQIDCNEKEYKKAKENYNEVINSLLTKGFAKASWFKIIWS